MAELFESYASDFTQLVDSVRDRIKADVSKLSADARRSALQHAEAEAEEANELLMQMEIEVKSFPQSVRERYTGKLRDLKSDYEKLQRDIVRIVSHAESAAAAEQQRQRPAGRQLYRRRPGGGRSAVAAPAPAPGHVAARARH